MTRKNHLRTLICSAPEGPAGCLTDGKRWDFVYLKPGCVRKVSRGLEEEIEGYEVYETRGLGARKKEEIKRIMGTTWISVTDYSVSSSISSRNFCPTTQTQFRWKIGLSLRKWRMKKRNGVV